MRKRYRWNKSLQKMVLVAQGETRRDMAPMIMRDSFEGVRPLSDPSVVFNSRRDMEEYCKKTGLDFLGDHSAEDFMPPSREEVQRRQERENIDMTREVFSFYEQNSSPDNNLHRLYQNFGIEYE